MYKRLPSQQSILLVCGTQGGFSPQCRTFNVSVTVGCFWSPAAFEVAIIFLCTDEQQCFCTNNACNSHCLGLRQFDILISWVQLVWWIHWIKCSRRSGYVHVHACTCTTTTVKFVPSCCRSERFYLNYWIHVHVNLLLMNTVLWKHLREELVTNRCCQPSEIHVYM